MLHNRKALAWLMVALLVLAGCSSTPRVVETKPNPTVVTPEIRAQIEADPEVQTLILLAKNEGKGLDWTKATQSADSNDSLVVQVPIYISEETLELVVVTFEQNRVTSVLLSRLSREREKELIALAFSDLKTHLVVNGTVDPSQGRPVFQKVIWGINRVGSTQTLGDLLELQSLERDSLHYSQANCSEIIANYVAATAALVAATYALYATCNPFTFWTPACLIAVVSYSLALSSYNYWANQMIRHGCVY
ncbi:hypothetical protein [Meiothermus ruber]|jgi:hypothetical protein|uniref:Lipoprotein n=1 Tax=Meiothermus ruber (strain ATCC 35948 / DSM 1279 / VKM B-1258 / 21) TaxID=504728 RepID=A0A806CU79_MEIRD|nr:hypothetical protein [Meiothermus ruber]ADD27018.1 hypothetical protein Mrub_0239 [Meiothermus ruber DSM 1279]MCL6531373.1 hypothetical protein [Meiothermus ruber]